MKPLGLQLIKMIRSITLYESIVANKKCYINFSVHHLKPFNQDSWFFFR